MYLIVQPFWIDENRKEEIRPVLLIVDEDALKVRNPRASRRFLLLQRQTVFQLSKDQDANFQEIDSKTFWKAWKTIGGNRDNGGKGSPDRIPEPPKGPKPSSGLKRRMELAGVR